MSGGEWQQVMLAIAFVSPGLGGGAVLARFQCSYSGGLRRWTMRSAYFLLTVAAITALAGAIGLIAA